MKDSFITVVVPAHDREQYIAAAIESILEQAHEPLEVLVVDDGSTDETAAIARGFPQTRVIRRRRGGPAAARNSGVAEARGELLAFLDSDDLWVRGKLKLQLEALRREPSPLMAFGWVQEFESVGPPDRGTHRAVPYVAPVRGVCCGTLLIPRAVFEDIGPFDESLRAGEFIDWYSRARHARLREVVVPEVVLLRRRHQSNLGLSEKGSRNELVRAIGHHLRRVRAGDEKS